MTPTEMARRSDSLYHDGINRRELCNMIAHLESDLSDERQSVETLGDENDRLRKLVRRMWSDARLMDANRHISDMRLTGQAIIGYCHEFKKLGIDVD